MGTHVFVGLEEVGESSLVGVIGKRHSCKLVIRRDINQVVCSAHACYIAVEGVREAGVGVGTLPAMVEAFIEQTKGGSEVTAFLDLVADIGNGTMNVMYLNNGRPIESKSWTEKLGVNQCFIRIQNRIMDRTGTKLPDEIINDFLRYGDADVSEAYLSAMKLVAEQYVQELFQKLRDYEYNEDLMKLYVMGGGAKMVEIFGKYNPDRTTFNHDICANAKGYEYFCYMMLRQKNRK